MIARRSLREGVRRREAHVAFERGRAAEARVRPVDGVAHERGREPPVENVHEQAGPAVADERLERGPEPLDERDRARLADGEAPAEPASDPVR